MTYDEYEVNRLVGRAYQLGYDNGYQEGLTDGRAQGRRLARVLPAIARNKGGRPPSLSRRLRKK